MSVAKLPMIDPEAAAAELRRCVTELGMVGMVTPQHVRDKNLDDPSFDVVWQTAEQLGVAVCVHGGGQAIDQVPIGVDRWKTRLEVHAFTHPVGQMVAVMAFTVGGILHRFPKLRVAFLEAGTRLAAVLARSPRRALGADARAGAAASIASRASTSSRALLHRLRSRTSARAPRRRTRSARTSSCTRPTTATGTARSPTP